MDTVARLWAGLGASTGIRADHFYLLLALLFISGRFIPGQSLLEISQGSERAVIISEVAWAGTMADESAEWIELHSNQDAAVDITGWTIFNDAGPIISLSGTIEPSQFFLLERRDDDTIIDINADQIFNHSLKDTGETLFLQDNDSNLIDTANISGGGWPAGTAQPLFLSMERASPNSEDEDSQWVSNDLVRNGMDSGGNPIAGTPGQTNSSWIPMGGITDLEVDLTGPSKAAAGTIITYTIGLANSSQFTATGILLTDLLPDGIMYLSDNSGFPHTVEEDHEIIWQAGDLGPAVNLTFDLLVQVGGSALGERTNTVVVDANEVDIDESNNTAHMITTIVGTDEPKILIDSVYYDGYELNDLDEAVHLINLSDFAVNLSGWNITDNSSSISFAPGSWLDSDQGIWITKEADAFRRQFGFEADFAVEIGSTSASLLDGVWPGFSNSGDEVVLLDNQNNIVDVLVYEEGNTGQNGWTGVPVAPYKLAGVFAEEGQILYRLHDWKTGEYVPDTDKAVDWSQSLNDPINGRKVRYPGWDIEQFFFPTSEPTNEPVAIFVAPDNAFPALEREILKAVDSIWIETHTFRSYALAVALSDASKRGLEVIVLLEGSPVGGIDDSEKLSCQILEAAGGQCWFMISDDSLSIEDRYRYLHAKFIIFDGRRALIASENLSPDSLPTDEKSDGTWGRRGIFILTDADDIVDGLQDIWQVDLDPANHQDLFRWSAEHSRYGPPTPGTKPITDTGGTGYSIRFPDIFTAADSRNFTLEQSPENSLGEGWGSISLLNRAGSGDVILVQQLIENLHWGPGNSNRQQDPNPRLEAMIGAARRGAKVRLLLDSFFSSRQENEATCLEINFIAEVENLDLACATANPTGLGIHNKMMLIQLDGQGFVHVGSINGTELSHKGNREVALLFQSNEAYDYLRDLFEFDWPHELFLPIMVRDFIGRSDHLLISEVYYDPTGTDETEYVEIVNPSGRIIDLSNFSLGDAVNKTDYEDLRRFPNPTYLPPGEVLVISAAGEPFFSRFGFHPDFEIIDTDPMIPDLIDDPDWGEPTALFQLGNLGDEILLRNGSDDLIDGIAYGTGNIDGHISCSLAVTSGRVLERNPFWRDTDNCPADFTNYSLPDPGEVRESRN